jgi:NADH:ubiquinone oxidoreductase subunit 3 (subunit A)
LPWLLLVSNNMPIESGISMCFFILTLTIGFVYEFIKGALDWK